MATRIAAAAKAKSQKVTKACAGKRSKILDAMHETARDFYDVGLMDLTTMHKFDALCLPEIPKYTPAQIKGIRAKCKASQAVFARCMNVSTSSLQKWEIGEKKPSNIALKLLNVVERKGLDAII
jgi:putative transcriptional regulator